MILQHQMVSSRCGRHTRESERKFVTEVDDVAVLIVHTWIKRIPQLIRGYELKDICNMEELTCISNFFSERELVEKAKSHNIC